MQEYLFSGARILAPARAFDAVADLAVKDGVIVAPAELSSRAKKIDLKGKLIAPGFFDMHVHLREPGQTHKEDIASGTRAAAAGGFTGLLAMPNTDPPISSVEDFLQQQKLLAQKALIPVLQCVSLTQGREGKALNELMALRQAGVKALSDDGGTPQDEELMRRAMLAAKEAGLPIIDHCEDYSLSRPGVMHEGAVSRRLGLPGQPRLAEKRMVQRDIRLCRETGCRVHLQHLSSAGSVKMLRQARQEGLPISGEVMPHHLLFTDQDVEKYGVNAKMAPPLREESDRQALLEALCEGSISVLATDHAPHSQAEKALGMLKAPFGITGLEQAVALCLTLLYHSGKISLAELIKRFSCAPREILQMPQLSLEIGETAELTIIDLEQKHQLSLQNSCSKARNCPYEGMSCKGKPWAVFSQGRLLKTQELK